MITVKSQKSTPSYSIDSNTTTIDIILLLQKAGEVCTHERKGEMRIHKGLLVRTKQGGFGVFRPDYDAIRARGEGYIPVSEDDPTKIDPIEPGWSIQLLQDNGEILELPVSQVDERISIGEWGPDRTHQELEARVNNQVTLIRE